MSGIVAIVLLSNHAYLILNNNRYIFIACVYSPGTATVPWRRKYLTNTLST